jgi:hypothetical protein
VRSRSISMLIAACGIALCAGAPSPVPATQLNVTANECQPLQSPPENFLRSEKGIYTAPEVTGSDRQVICSVPRSSDPGGAGFYIDGDNAAGAFTDCMLISWAENQGILAQRSFHAVGKYDVFLTFVSGQVDPRGFFTLNCMLPPQGQGILRGMTSFPSL